MAGHERTIVAIAENVTAANSEHSPAWLPLALKEYEALRAEILATMDTQQGTLRFGTAALSILAVGAFNVWEDKLVTTLAFLFVAPFLSKLVITIWMGEVTRMMRAGDHLKRVEDRFHELFPEMPKPVMSWETSLRDPTSATTRWKRHYEWNYLAIVLMFWSIAVASMALGVYQGLSGGLPISDAGVWALAGVVFLASVGGLFLVLRQLATVCQTQGVLRRLRRKERETAAATPASTSRSASKPS
jgi:hypothetical protein